MKRGVAPSKIAAGIEAIRTQGSAMARITWLREELGLQKDVLSPNMSEVRKLLKPQMSAEDKG